MQQFSVAQFAAVYVNSHMGEGSDPVTVNHFLAFPFEAVEKAEAERKKAYDLAMYMRMTATIAMAEKVAAEKEKRGIR